MKTTAKTAIVCIIVVAAIICTTQQTTAQILDPRAWKKEHVINRKPITWTHLREADVMWAKRVWRVLDMREKINLPLYFPHQPVFDRISLYDLLKQAMLAGNGDNPPHPKGFDALTAYNSDQFTEFYTPEEVIDRSIIRYVRTQLNDYGETEAVDDSTSVSTDRVVQFRLMEDWFFDRNRSVMDVRIIGIAPVFYGFRLDDSGETVENPFPSIMCWFYLPEARKFLIEKKVFNRMNDAQRLSFDDVFLKRFFGSYIYKEQNVFDRTISEYAIGMDALLEAERAKYDVFKMEHDLWEY